MRPYARAMKQLKNSAYPSGNKKGQALVELAIFGTVLIFCLTLLLRYGMNATYSQNTNMETFRKGFVRASSSDSSRSGSFNPNWKYENANPALPSNHWRNVSYTVIKDKPMLSASGILPIAERTPVGSGVEAVRSIDMFARMEYGVQSDLPRVEYEVNGKRYSFTIAGFKQCAEHSDMRTKEDIKDWDGRGVSWEWKTVSKAEIGDSVDVDGDGYEEYVLEKSGDILKLLDYQEGEVNLSEPIVASAREKGGLQGDYDKQINVAGSTFRRRESASGITTTDTISAEEIFARAIKTRSGDYNVVDKFITKKTETWYTPHE